MPDRTYHFFAVWPYSGVDNSPVTNVSSVAGDGAYAYNVTFTTSEAADQELLTAKKTEMTVTGNSFPSSVDFQFEHQLTNIHFKVWRNGEAEGLNDLIKVKKVELGNVTKRGRLTTTLSGSSWRLYNEKTSFAKEYTTPLENDDISSARIENGTLVDYGDSPAVPFGNDGLLLIPHTINSSNPVIVKVIYDYYNEEIEDWEEKTLQALLPEGTWPAGKRLTYNLIISGENTITQFQINTVVEDWDRQTDEIDFSQTVTCSAKMEWVPGTFESHDDVNCKIVLYSDKSITATISGNNITVTLDATTSYVITLTNEVRLNSLDVTYLY